VSFLRHSRRPLQQIAWVLALSVSAIGSWNQGFDQDMKPLKIPDHRGKASKVTAEVVRRICEKAKVFTQQAKRIRIARLTKELRKDEAIVLSCKTVKEILIANDLAAVRTRKRRPRFYQSLCQKIPNGLLSLDGSELSLWLGNQRFTFNVELAVDVASFTHTGFSIADSETAQQLIQVLEIHRQNWGTPLGIVCDSGSANLSQDVRDYLQAHGIELVAAGPYNPKGNGTDEGAFSLMKKTLGFIRLDLSSPKALAKSILHTLISVYVKMRNRLCLQGRSVTPSQQMSTTVSEQQQHLQRQKLNAHQKLKVGSDEDQRKIERLHWVIEHYGLQPEAVVLKRAQYSIKAYELQAIGETEKAFVTAVRRKSDRCNLAYFFGILNNIQRQRDEQAQTDYCRKRYNYQVMCDRQRSQLAEDPPVSIDAVIGMLEKAVTPKKRFVKELALRTVRKWTEELMKQYKYLGVLKKKLSDAIGKLDHLNLQQKQEAWELIEQFINLKPAEKSVTLSS
jgi:transposase InsO family protein